MTCVQVATLWNSRGDGARVEGVGGGGGSHAGSSVSSELVMSRIKNGVQICDRVILS